MIWPNQDPATAVPFGRSELPEGNYLAWLEVAPMGLLGTGDVPIIAPIGLFGTGDVPIANVPDEIAPADVPAAIVLRSEIPAKTTKTARTNDKKYFFTWFSSSQI